MGRYHNMLFVQVILLAIFILLTGCSGSRSDDSSGSQEIVTPEQIIKDARLDLLTDQPYYFPATGSSGSGTEYQVLRKWDIIFAGGLGEHYEGRGVTSLLIPGSYDHLLVYVGKDAQGNAYAAELNVDTLEMVSSVIKADGGIRLYCLGSDYGDFIHVTGSHLFRENYYTMRRGKTFIPSIRSNLTLHDHELISQVREDLRSVYPYQLEFNADMKTLMTDKKFLLIDDGRKDGAGCADYWTSLYEEKADVCLKGSRMRASEIMDYFFNDPEGAKAIIPANLNPFGTGDIFVSSLLGYGGITIDEPAPHIFSCDGTTETGLVTPNRVFTSTMLTEPEPAPQHP